MMNATLPNDWKVEVVDEKIIGKREFFGDKTKHCIIMGEALENADQCEDYFQL